MIIVLIVISFNLIANTLWCNYFSSAGTVKVPDVNNTVEKWNTGVILTGVQPIARTIVSTKPVVRKNRTSEKTNKTDEGWAKPLLGWVSAGYDGETVFERVINRLIYIWVDTWTSDFIARKCFSTAINPKHCVKSVVWVATPESSLFKRCKDNNCMWLKPSWELKWYDTLNLALDDWINRYNKYRYKNDSGKDWIVRSHYCKWDCSDLSDRWSNWTRAFDWTVNKLWI